MNLFLQNIRFQYVNEKNLTVLINTKLVFTTN